MNTLINIFLFHLIDSLYSEKIIIQKTIKAAMKEETEYWMSLILDHLLKWKTFQIDSSLVPAPITNFAKKR